MKNISIRYPWDKRRHFMASIREYLEKKETEELRGILRADCRGRFEIPLDAVLLICDITRERNPRKPDPWQAYSEFLEQYLTDTENTL